jgi:hypothetical protein
MFFRVSHDFGDTLCLEVVDFILNFEVKIPNLSPRKAPERQENTPLKQHYDMSTEEVIKFKDIETGDEIFFFNVSDMVIHKVEVYNTLKTIRLVQLNTSNGSFVVDANRSSCGLDSEDTWKNPQIYVATSEEIIERWKKRIEEKRK